MANKHLFFQYGYNGFFNGRAETSQLAPFNCIEMEAQDTDKNPYYQTSIYAKAVGRVEQMNFIPGIARAIQRILVTEIAGPIGFGGYGVDKFGDIFAEYWDDKSELFNNGGFDLSKGRRIIMKMDLHNDISAVCIDEYGGETPYSIMLSSRDKNAHSASAAIYMILLGIILRNGTTEVDTLVKAHFDQLMEYCNAADQEGMRMASRVLENDLYAIIAHDDKVINKYGINAINPAQYTNPTFQKLSSSEIENVEFDWFKGHSNVFNQKSTKKKTTATKRKPILQTVADLVNAGTYTLNESRVLTEDELEMIPKMDEMVPDKEILTKIELIKGSTLSPRPFRNLLWVGETGTGKTTAAQIAAQLMNLPYTFMTFNPDTILSDLYVNILPSNKKTQTNIPQMSELLEMSVFNPKQAFAKLTGIEKDVTTQDVIGEILSRSLEQSSDFMYVESPLVQAYRYGWLCELQEVNLAMKPGVLGGINAALDDLQTMQLPDGQIIKRHPDCVVVMTANVDYEGTRKLNQAVRSRLTLKGTFELPEESILTERIIHNSGLTDKDTVKKMIKVMKAIRKVLEESGETNGSCSVREVQSWAQATNILKDPYEAALATVVPSASDDPEVIVDVLSALETQFVPKI